MNQKGYSWPEAILTLTALMVIFGTLLPFATKMTSKLNDKKLAMHAAETAFHGTIAHHAYGKLSGVRQVEKMEYEWRIESDSICVSYRISSRVVTKCLDY